MENKETENTEKKPEYRISNTVGVGMLAVAVIYDLLSLIPVVTYIVIPLAWLHFWLWFQLHGVNIGFADPKKLLTMGGVSLIEIIPGVGNISPTWVLGIGLQLFLVRTEDKTGISVSSVGDIVKGGKRNVKKMARRAKRSPEKQREAIQRLNRMQDVKRT